VYYPCSEIIHLCNASQLAADNRKTLLSLIKTYFLNSQRDEWIQIAECSLRGDANARARIIPMIAVAIRFPNAADRDTYGENLASMIRRLPSSDEQARIISRITEIAAKANYAVDRLCWFDINVKRENNLDVVLSQNGKTLNVALTWQHAVKGEHIVETGSYMWIPVPGSDFGRRLIVESPDYSSMKREFQNALGISLDQTPLPIPTKVNGKHPRLSSFIDGITAQLRRFYSSLRVLRSSSRAS
jgi:hypothetical protein